MQSVTTRSAPLLAVAGTILSATAAAQVDVDPDEFEDYRSRQEIDIRGSFRDFAPFDQPGGHPDFGAIAIRNYGRFALVPVDLLDGDGKPEYNTTGYQVLQPWTDGEGRYRMPQPRAYVDEWAGDLDGSLSEFEGGAVSAPAPFAQWFRDTAGMATSQEASIRLARVEGTDNYLFEGFMESPGLHTGEESTDPAFASNTTYTCEFDTTFVYEDDRAYFIEASSAGDYWIYIDNRMVIDGGAGVSLPTDYAGIIVDGRVTMDNAATVDLARGTYGQVNTNASGAETVYMKNEARINADVNVGPGGDTSDITNQHSSMVTGDKGVLSEPIPMPPMPAVPDFGPSTGSVTYSSGTYTFEGDLHCDDFIMDTDADLTLTGPTRIVCDGTFEIKNDCVLSLARDATLEIHVINGPIFMGNNSRMNIPPNSGDPVDVQFFNHSTSEIYMDNGFIAYANFYSPQAQMRIANGIELFGSFFGQNLDMTNGAKFTMMAPQKDIVIWGEGIDLAGEAQRIDLDRLGWLQDRRTYRLKVFFADRVWPKSQFRMQTNIVTLNLATAARDTAKVD